MSHSDFQSLQCAASCSLSNSLELRLGPWSNSSGFQVQMQLNLNQILWVFLNRQFFRECTQLLGGAACHIHSSFVNKYCGPSLSASKRVLAARVCTWVGWWCLRLNLWLKFRGRRRSARAGCLPDTGKTSGSFWWRPGLEVSWSLRNCCPCFCLRAITLSW